MTKLDKSYLYIVNAIVISAAALTTSCSHSEKAEIAGPVKVTVQTVDPGRLNNDVSFSGTVESAETATLSFSVPGTITDIYVEEGQNVSKGQVLARVRNSNYVNARNIAEAELAEARDAYARLKKLHDANALPDIKWVEVQNKLKQAENAAEMSKRAVSDAALVAPVSGVVSRKIANVGQSVIPAEPVLELVTVNDIRINVSVPESEIGGIAEGQGAIVNFKNLGIDSLAGRVVRKSVVADPLTRAYTVKISIQNTDGRILPGMVGDVALAAAHSADTVSSSDIMLPSQAVLLGSDNRTFVWVVDGGKAARRFVKADELSAGGIIVTDGLRSGDSVIVAGMQKVGTGTPVTAETEK
ncbi:MAG: efflux RND transporter periplasmic adaptor subunit [Bacteroidales bacterium]|nr:efflux RND transporter periplasmic adaptor subunit [Bacteroidales bacterium]